MRKRSRLLIVALITLAVVGIAATLAVPVVSLFLPDYRDIEDVIGSADTLLVREVGVAPGGATVGGKLLYEVRESEDVQSVLDMISFRKDGWRSPCRCRGYPVLEWKKGDVCLAVTTLKHTATMHWVGVGDGLLDWDSGDRLRSWLIDHGVNPDTAPGGGGRAHAP
jgi:hypothetical protein